MKDWSQSSNFIEESRFILLSQSFAKEKFKVTMYLQLRCMQVALIALWWNSVLDCNIFLFLNSSKVNILIIISVTKQSVSSRRSTGNTTTVPGILFWQKSLKCYMSCLFSSTGYFLQYSFQRKSDTSLTRLALAAVGLSCLLFYHTWIQSSFSYWNLTDLHHRHQCCKGKEGKFNCLYPFTQL